MSSKQRDVLRFFDRFNSTLKTLEDDPFDVVSPLPAYYGRLAKGEHFSVFKKAHAEEATSVYNFLLNLQDDKVFSNHVFKFKRDLNEGLFIYALSVAWLHRKGTAGTQLPPPWEINPTNFFPIQLISRARKAARRGKDGTDADSEPLEFVTGTVRDVEFKLSWWREDIGLNGHHLHWHEVYPNLGINGETADRQGELFYYMHQQMLARYDAERLAVGLMRVEPLNNWHLPIPEGYNPHLTANYGAHQFAARSSNLYLADSWRGPDKPLLVSKLEYSYHRLLNAINSGKFFTKKNEPKNDNELLEVTIDRLGAAVEASVSSPNNHLYGDLHNDGHILLSSVADPDHRYQTSLGVMSDIATAVRDPIFFRWHKFIDNLFVEHKLALDSYTMGEMKIKDLKITDVYAEVEGGKKNTLTTRMVESKVDISHDMFLEEEEKEENSGGTDSSVYVKVLQVNHDNFKYNIAIHSEKEMQAVIRVFIAPKLDEHGRRYSLNMQRRLYIEMDKFVCSITTGDNDIIRSSTESSVIKPADLSIKELKTKLGNNDSDSKAYCKCGWPDHMLLPRGTGRGMQFDLFVMATDWTKDKTCGNLDRGSSYCGLLNKKYPDKRAMGFPFDREFDEEFDRKSIDDFAKEYCNAYVVPICIKYE